MPKKKRTRRRTKTRFGLLNAVESYWLLNTMSSGITGLNLPQFLFADTGVAVPGMGGYSTGSGPLRISLKELISNTQELVKTGKKGGGYTYSTGGKPSDIMWNNIQNNYMDMATKMVLIPIGFKMGRRLAAPAIRRGNKILKDVGLSMVKI
jgi:hypothetical protein